MTLRIDNETRERLALGGYGPVRGAFTGRVPNKLRELARIRHDSTGEGKGIAFLTLGEIPLDSARSVRGSRSQRAFRRGKAVEFVTRPVEPRKLHAVKHARPVGESVAVGVFKR